METLYESILDDEDVLVSKSINRSKNPFIILKSIYDNIDFDNDKKSYEKWQNAVHKELKKIDLPNWIKFVFAEDYIEFTAKIKENNVYLFTLIYNPESVKIAGAICYMFCYYKHNEGPDSLYRKLNQEQLNWIKNFENIYGFKPNVNLNKYWKVLK